MCRKEIEKEKMRNFINNKILDLMSRMGLLESNLMEMAFHKKEYIEKIKNVRFQIIKHILKLLLFGKNSPNFDHWMNEIVGWISQINDIELKYGTSIKSEEIYKILYIKPLEDTIFIEKRIPPMIKDYPREKVVWDTIPYLKFYEEYKSFFKELSEKLWLESMNSGDIKELIFKHFTIK